MPHRLLAKRCEASQWRLARPPCRWELGPREKVLVEKGLRRGVEVEKLRAPTSRSFDHGSDCKDAVLALKTHSF
jgi:hypothetical protein